MSHPTTLGSKFPLYSPLDEEARQMRVLSIPPRALDESLDLELITISLKDDPKYNAVSYVWGDPNIIQNIRVNQREVPVTTNLADALRYISLWMRTEGRTEPLYLWADDLCINQRDIPERNQQVKLMSEIYSRADRVICWLGASDDYHGVVTALDGIGQRIAEDQRAGKARNGECFKDYPALLNPRTEGNESGGFASDTLLERGIVGLAENPFWERIWIIQELSLARDRWFLYRDQVLRGDHLEAFLRWLDDPPREPRSPEYERLWTWIIGFSQSAIASMAPKVFVRKRNLTPLSSTYFCLPFLTNTTTKASDPRDRIFALLGLCFGSSIDIDYSRSTREVYIDAAEEFVLHGDPHEFLPMAGMGHRQDWENPFGLPSWVPDWEDISKEFRRFTIPNDGEFSAGVGKEMRQSPDILQASGGVLRPVCIFFDAVEFVHEFGSAEDLRLFCIDYAESDSKPGPIYPGGLSRLHVIFQLAHHVFRQYFRHAEEDFAYRSFRSFLVFLLGVKSWTNWWSNVAESKEAVNKLLRSFGLPLDETFERDIRTRIIGEGEPSAYLAEGRPQAFLFPRYSRELIDDVASMPPYLAEILLFRRFFRTGKEHLALGPLGTKATDEIIVIPGYSYPFLIRNLNGRYYLVGPCYVVGIMKGEVGLRFRNDELSLEELEIY